MIEWRQIPFLPDYDISDAGQVRRRRDSVVHKAGRLNVGFLNNGYRRYLLVCPDGKRRKFWAHRLVLETFVGERPSKKYQVAHADGDRLNNHISNLRWATMKENCADRDRHGTTARGERGGNSKLTADQVCEIRQKYSPKKRNQEALAREYGVSRFAIQCIRTRQTWKHI